MQNQLDASTESPTFVVRTMKRLIARGKSRRGQSLVELALVLPLLMLFLLITIDFGRIYFSNIQVTNASREAANYAALNPTDTVNILAVATRETNAQSQNGESALQIPPPVCKDAAGTVITCATANLLGSGPGNTISVTVREKFSFMTPFIDAFWANNFWMSRESTATVFGYVASGGGPPPAGCAPPTPAFTILADSTLTISVDPAASTPASGTCSISGFNWTWGDGNTDVGSSSGSSHLYGGAGTYTVILEVTNQGGSNVVSHVVTVPAPPPPPVCAKPTVNFSWTHPGGNSKAYDYHDNSTVGDPVNCPITNWLWTFTDLGTQSNAKNPTTQTYGNNSNHSVTLQVTNAAGSSSLTLNT